MKEEYEYVATDREKMTAAVCIIYSVAAVVMLVMGNIVIPSHDKEKALLEQKAFQVATYICFIAAHITGPGMLKEVVYRNVYRANLFAAGSGILLGAYLSGTYFAVPISAWCIYKSASI